MMIMLAFKMKWLLLFVCAFCYTSVAPQTTEERISGIKYVVPLNSIAGYTQQETDEKYQCYRCNHYKGGGAACPETQQQIPGSNVPADSPPAEMIVKGCEVCLKVFTTMYFRNKDYIADKFIVQRGKHFEPMYVTSRACIVDKKDARLTKGCITDTSAGGSIKRCYCTGNLCNNAVLTSGSFTLVIVLLSALFALNN